MWEYTQTEDLYHHGVQGQKWGVRRYQNADGSLTPAGKKHLDKLKQGEISKIDKMYGRMEKGQERILKKSNSRYEKSRDKYGENDYRTVKEKVIARKDYADLGFQKALHLMEKESVKNMTLAEINIDIDQYKKYTAYLRSNAIAGRIVVGDDPATARTKRRISPENQHKAIVNAIKDAVEKYPEEKQSRR